jgi:hypothetical protein
MINMGEDENRFLMGRDKMMEQLDSCEYLFLVEISEPHPSSLHLLIEEARVSDNVEDIKIGNSTISDCRRVKHDESCRVFEVEWDSCISYGVTNESYASFISDGYVGRRVRRYSRSAFLDYVQKSTFATDDYPGPYRHIGIICEDHIVDVASTKDPRVTIRKFDRPRAIKS